MSIFFLILVIFLIIGFSVLFWRNNTPVNKGKVGEIYVHNILLELPDEYYIMDDVVLNTVRGTTQIDHIVISRYGVFVIETKNYSGNIYGNDESNQWTQKILTDVVYRKKRYKTYTYLTKNKFYNPVKQALGHMYEVKNSLKEWPYLKVVPIVVFAGTAALVNVNSKNHVIHETDLLATILSYKTSYLSDADLLKVVERLNSLNVREYVDDATHLKNVREAKKDLYNKLSSGICPKCGGTLVERTGKYGRFIGCSNYPKCTFTTEF